jgi:hypothetical protein
MVSVAWSNGIRYVIHTRGEGLFVCLVFAVWVCLQYCVAIISRLSVDCRRTGVGSTGNNLEEIGRDIVDIYSAIIFVEGL